MANFKSGDTVRCIDARGLMYPFVSLGTTYTVAKGGEGGMVVLKDIEPLWPLSVLRFELVEE